jgi:proteic killer suppression protein
MGDERGTVRLEFADDRLRRLYVERGYAQKRFGPDVVKAFRAKVQLIAAATNEHDLRNLASLHLEQLKGDRRGTSSIRLNRQWRLVLRFRTDPDGRTAVILEITDYH